MAARKKAKAANSSRKQTKKPAKRKSSKRASPAKRESQAKPAREGYGTAQTPISPARSAGVWITVGVVIGVIILLAIGWLLLRVDAMETTADVVVSVNGQPITLEEIQVAYERLPASLQETYTPKIILNQTIDKVLLLQYADEKGIKVTQNEIDAEIVAQSTNLGTSPEGIRSALEESNIAWDEFELAIKEELVLRKVIEDDIMKKVDIPDSAIQAYYQANIEKYTADDGESRIRHILLESEDEANDVHAQAVAGQDFALLAQANSVGPTGPDGGSLGFITEASPLVEPFKTVALGLDVGEISDPVETQFGWHIIFRDTDVIPLRDARSQISEVLVQEAARQQFADLLAQLRADATIQYYRSIDGDFLANPGALA